MYYLFYVKLEIRGAKTPLFLGSNTEELQNP